MSSHSVTGTLSWDDSGVAGYEIVTNSVYPGNQSANTLTVNAPSGKKVVGGGFHCETVNPKITGSYPSTGGSGWNVNYANAQGETVTVYAICVTV